MEPILLRYRDTSDLDTIAEHQKLITKSGHVWWGWWKKESEPDRTEIIRKIAAAPAHYSFYIFDRSTTKFFKAHIIELSDGTVSRISTPEKDHTPTYYQDEQLPLWLKLTKLSEIGRDEFLKIFKVIPDQNYSFFTKEDINADVAATTVVGKQFVNLKSDYILHLSDIHFGDDFGFPRNPEPGKQPLADIIVNTIRNDLKVQLGLLIVSGDITSRGVSDILVTDGLEFLEKLCTELNLKREEVIIIPGNHDIPLQKVDMKDYHHEKLYRNFLQLFYGKSTDLFGLESFRFPCGLTADIMRMHSVKLRKEKESNYGYAEWPLYDSLLNNHPPVSDLKIAVIHHHLVSASIEEVLDPDYPFGSISVTIDSGRIIDGLQKFGFKIVLNGHQHIPGITRISRGQKTDTNEILINDESMLTILSAGSAGAKKERLAEEMPFNSFSIYKISPETIDIEVKAYSPGTGPRRHYHSILAIGGKVNPH
ncbi:putative MPP superfamily phosphohydrolase [Mucilaginibacter sp. UYP25]|uniref:metallophosphoesterase family protein n=1 Tax=unclassified Mucilaginibacter TaxID=2617802 RepID=UPI003391CB94